MDRSPSSDARFRRLFEEHADAMRSYCIRRLERHAVDDAVADVFAIAWRRWDKVPTDDGALPYLYGVARNVVRNHQRAARRHARLATRARSVAAVGTQTGPEAQVVVRQEERIVLEAMEQLRPADQELLRLRAWEELSRHDIAATLDISPGAVDMRLNRAMKRMATALRSAGFDHQQPGPAILNEEAS